MVITGTRVTGHIANQGRRIEFTGTVIGAYRTGRQDVVNVACDDGQERTALAENVEADEHVTSVRGGKTHLAAGDSPVPFPLCGSASRNTATRFRRTAAPVDCRECTGILARRATRLANH